LIVAQHSRTLQTHTFREIKRATKDIDQLFIALNLSSDIAFKTSQVSSQSPQLLPCAFKLLGMSIALMRNEGSFADVFIRLAQGQLMFLRQTNQAFSPPMRQAGVCWKGSCFLLNSRLDDNFGKI
jgi:hypothetical protein